MLATMGGETGGYAFMVKDGKPTFIYSYIGLEHYTITATEAAAEGQVLGSSSTSSTTAAARARAAPARCRSTARRSAKAGSRKPCPVMFSTDDTFDVGEDWGTPVSPDLQAPGQVHRHDEEGDGGSRRE